MFERFFLHILRHTQISMNHRSLVQHIVFEPGNATGSVQQLGEPWSHQRTSGVALPQHLQQGRAKRGCGSGAWKVAPTMKNHGSRCWGSFTVVKWSESQSNRQTNHDSSPMYPMLTFRNRIMSTPD